METDMIATSANLTVVLLFFVFALLILHFFLVHKFPLSNEAWKKTDYIWLAAAALGLISASSQVRVMISTVEAPRAEIHAESLYINLQKLFTLFTGAENLDCTKPEKTYLSTEELEFWESRANYDEACRWLMSASSSLLSFPSNPDFNAPVIIPEIPSSLEANPIHPLLWALQRQHSYYENQSMKVEKIRGKTKPTNLESLLILLSPWLLALALALRITKVTGELRN